MGCALVVRGQPCRATDTGRRLCQHVDRVRLLEQELQGALPALAPEGLTRVALPIAVNADSLATWFAPAVAAFAAACPGAGGAGGGRPGPHRRVAAQRRRAGGRDRHGPARRRAATAGRWVPCAISRPPARPIVARHFANGVGAGSLARAPSLVFNTKDDLQARWVRRLCHRDVELPRHTVPSAQAFVTAALAGMGWGLHPAGADRTAPGRAARWSNWCPIPPLDVPLYWQHARAASSLIDGLSREVLAAAARALRPP